MKQSYLYDDDYGSGSQPFVTDIDSTELNLFKRGKADYSAELYI